MARDDPKQYYCVKKILKKEIPVSKQTNEIDLLDQLHHPDIVRLYEVFEDTNAFYIVLEYE
jgi:serine/threonine protein kinase